MLFGASMFFTDYSMGAGELARALEERGFESVWAPEHSHIPVSRQSAFPSGGELPKQYYDVMDPFVSLTYAAAVTKTIKLAPASVSSPSATRSRPPNSSPHWIRCRAGGFCSGSAAGGMPTRWPTTAPSSSLVSS